jgi:hypothetical protein
VDRPSPLIYTAADGREITLGEISFVIVICIPTVPSTVDTCGCLIAVNLSNPFVEMDLCDRCTVTAISATEFDNVFYCSNRLPAGLCVGLDTGQNCISSAGVVLVPLAPVTIPAPVQVVSTPAPVNEPVEVEVPTSYECPGTGKGKKKGGKEKRVMTRAIPRVRARVRKTAKTRRKMTKNTPSKGKERQ